jgi:predicted ATPase
MLRLGRQRDDAVGVVLGHLSCARCLLYRGRFGQSKSHLEAGLALYDPIAHRSLVDQTGIHPQVYFQAYLALVLFCLGFLDKAFAHSDAAIAEARRSAHPPSLAAGLTVGTWFLSLDGNDAALNERAEELVALTTEQGFPHWGAVGTLLRGCATVKNGDVTEGMSLLRSALAAYRATGAELFAPLFLSHLARACEITGRIGEAFALLDDALQIVERTGERWIAAELNRHKGRLLLTQGHAEAAENFFRKATSPRSRRRGSGNCAPP